MSLAIEIQKLVKQYPAAPEPALNELSYSVKEHTITGLLGPNGAGKTTCISVICGLIAPDSGSVTVLGEDVTSDIQSIRKRIGVVPQRIALFPNLTARENFSYIGRLYGIPEANIKDRSQQLLVRLGLEKHADKRVRRYSGGMKRRANIIASLLHAPQLLILDEPTAGVDVQSRALILEFLKDYHSQGHTILYTSHLLEEAERLCEEVVIVDEGKHIVSGSPKELIAQNASCNNLEDVFLHYTGHTVRD